MSDIPIQTHNQLNLHSSLKKNNLLIFFNAKLYKFIVLVSVFGSYKISKRNDDPNYTYNFCFFFYFKKCFSFYIILQKNCIGAHS